MVAPGVEGLEVFVSDEVSVLRTMDDGKLHVSISCKDRYPTWDEIRDARYQLMPDEMMVAMLLPTKAQYVNDRKNCCHLHEL